MKFFKEINSPVGKLKLVANENELVAILWEKDRPQRVRLGALKKAAAHPILLKTEKQLSEYFAGKRKVFALPLVAEGTPFQIKVWEALRSIPYGETRSYGELAQSINPKASRAVGAANGRNPLSIVVPCHRVIATDGKLTGFAGGLRTKKFLLELEKKICIS